MNNNNLENKILSEESKCSKFRESAIQTGKKAYNAARYAGKKTWELTNIAYAYGGNFAASFATGLVRGYYVAHNQTPPLISQISHYALPVINGYQRMNYGSEGRAQRESLKKDSGNRLGGGFDEAFGTLFTLPEGVIFGIGSVIADWTGFGIGYLSKYVDISVEVVK